MVSSSGQISNEGLALVNRGLVEDFLWRDWYKEVEIGITNETEDQMQAQC